MTARPLRSRGFTLLECLAALACLGVAMVAAAELASFTLTERVRLAARMDAADLAENEMEAARATAWDDLTPEWAAKRSIPEYLAGRLPGGKLAVTVADEPGRPQVKRVSVTVTWTNPGGQPAKPVALVAMFASRAGGAP